MEHRLTTRGVAQGRHFAGLEGWAAYTRDWSMIDGKTSPNLEGKGVAFRYSLIPADKKGTIAAPFLGVTYWTFLHISHPLLGRKARVGKGARSHRGAKG